MRSKAQCLSSLSDYSGGTPGAQSPPSGLQQPDCAAGKLGSPCKPRQSITLRSTVLLSIDRPSTLSALQYSHQTTLSSISRTAFVAAAMKVARQLAPEQSGPSHVCGVTGSFSPGSRSTLNTNGG